MDSPTLDNLTPPPPLSLTQEEAFLAEIKEYLHKGREKIKERHLAHAPGSEIIASYTLLIDNLLHTVFTKMSSGLPDAENVALVALGGYGRRELNPGSDIDLMLLRSRRLSRAIKELTERMLYLLWDTGLDVAFSIRSVRESTKLAREDLKTQTTLLDARFIAGDKKLVPSLVQRLRKEVFTAKGTEKFIAEKLNESAARQEKYGGSVYILEPNVKECEGGLRDFHTLRWIAKVGAGIEDHEEIVKKELLTRPEFDKLLHSFDFVQRVRNDLHFALGRKGDQFTFDQQERMALAFGYKKGRGSLPVEELMGRYYQCAFVINHFSSRAITRLLTEATPAPAGARKGRHRRVIDGQFSIADGCISVIEESAFINRPELIIKVFEYGTLFNAKIDSRTIDLLLHARDSIDKEFRESKSVAESFLNILNSKNAFETLEEMHELRILGRYIPEFSDVTYRMQHDLYHIYTVDVHSLFAVREAEMLYNDYRHVFPELSSLYNEIDRHHILKLAILLHDIGKSHGKGHAARGAEITTDICARLGLTDTETRLVVFLVGQHLILANGAQYRDLHDEKFIIEFARSVGDRYRLDLLYLLTFADVRAVGPDVWTKWKGALFHELYTKTAAVIERGSFNVEEVLARLPAIEKDVTARLRHVVADEVVRDFFTLLPPRYFLSNSSGVIAGHIITINELDGKPFVIQVEQRPERSYTEITLSTADIGGLFSKVTGIMAAHNINIIGAQIYTMKNGLILDVLQANSSLGKMITDGGRLNALKDDLEKVLTGVVSIESLVAQRAPSILEQKAQPRIRTSIAVDNEVSDLFTVIDIHTEDSIGLLYKVTRALFDLGLSIAIAKISTKGGEATDIFYVRDKTNKKIEDKAVLRDIVEGLYERLNAPYSGKAAS